MKKRIILVLAALLLAFSATACDGNTNDKKSSGASAKKSSGTSLSESENGSDASGENSSGTDSADPAASVNSGGTASQGNQNSKNSNNGTSSKAPVVTDVNKIDMKGAEVVMRLVSLASLTNSAGMIDERNPLIVQIRKAEKQFKCKVKLQIFPNPQTIAVDTVTATQSGQLPFDFALIPIHHLKQQARQGILADMKKLSFIDLKSKNFTPAFTEMHTYNNKTFAVSFGHTGYGVFYNKETLRKYPNLTDPYTLYKEGKWTFSEFEKIAQATTTKGANNVTSNYGVACNMYLNGYSIVANAGGTITRDSNGKYTYSMIEQAGIDATTWVKSLFTKGYWYLSDDDSGAAGLNLFAQGKATMAPWFTSVLKTYNDIIDFEAGFVPFPKGPNMTKHNVGIYDGAAYSIHKNSKYQNECAAILQMMSEAHSALVEKEVTDIRSYGLDANGQSCIRELSQLTTPEFCMDIPTDVGEAKPGGTIIEDSIRDPAKTPATEIKRIKNAMIQAMNDYYSKNFK